MLEKINFLSAAENKESFFRRISTLFPTLDYRYQLIIAALLHDIIEDCPEWTVERLTREYGLEIALLVEWLSKAPLSQFDGDEEARDAAYHGRFEFAPREFFLIKLSDRLHNLITLWACSASKQRRKIEETKRFYVPYAERHLILMHEIDEALENLDTKKRRKAK